jgi:hypothetical protein
MTGEMTVSFARIKQREIKQKNMGQVPYLTFNLTVGMTAVFGSYFKDVMSVLTKVTDLFQKLFPGFFFSHFHKNYRLLLNVVLTGTFFIGMAHSLSLSAITIKKILL